jgi:hypothetical protein
VTTSHQRGSDIVMPVEQARWLHHTLAEAAELIDYRQEPRYLHHDLNYHAIWLQRRLNGAAARPEPSKESHP